jgi:predicted  nucleic acid-binding Zn-ribbon protein
MSSLAHRIGQANAAVQQLQSEIDQVHRQIRRLDQGLVALRDQYETGQSVWRAIMAEIDDLEAEVQRLENVFASERVRLQESLDQNSTGITNQQHLLEELHRHLESLSTGHNQTSQQLDHQETRSQELAQAIDSGRRNYDIIGENAETQSALADTTGFSLQEKTETEILQDQEFSAQFPHSLRRGMRGRKPLPTRSERRKNLHVSKV